MSFLPEIATRKNNMWKTAKTFEGFRCENARKLICPHNCYVTWVDNTKNLSKLLNLYNKLKTSGVELTQIDKVGLCLYTRKYYILYKHPNNCLILDTQDIRVKNIWENLKQIDNTFGKCKIGLYENKLIILNLKFCSRKKHVVTDNKITK